MELKKDIPDFMRTVKYNNLILEFEKMCKENFKTVEKIDFRIIEQSLFDTEIKTEKPWRFLNEGKEIKITIRLYKKYVLDSEPNETFTSLKHIFDNMLNDYNTKFNNDPPVI